MSRFLLRAILAAILAWLLGGAGVSHAAVSLPSHVACAYNYSGQETPAAVTDPGSERGPPAPQHPDNTYDPDRPRLLGISARADGQAARSTCDCDGSPRSVDLARGSRAVDGRTDIPLTGHSVVERVRVAAKTPIGFAPGEGVSALTANRLQHGTRHLTEAGALPAWRGKSSPDLIRRTLSTILERPTGTFDHTLRGGAPVKGFLGEIDGQQVALMVYKQGPYQGQLATSVAPTPSQLSKWGF